MYEKLFIQKGRSSFLQCIFSNYFYSLNKSLGSAVRTKLSQAVGVASNLCWAICFHGLTGILSEMPMVPIAKLVGKQGSDALGTGSNRSIYLYNTFIHWYNFEFSWIVLFLLVSKLKPSKKTFFCALWFRKLPFVGFLFFHYNYY